MRNPMPTLALALVGTLAAGAALAQVPPPPPAPDTAPAGAVAPPPPPPGATAPAPSPPTGAHILLDRGANGFVHVDVKCADRETTQDCAGIAERMLAKLAGR